jgi:hypothetical protein
MSEYCGEKNIVTISHYENLHREAKITLLVSATDIKIACDFLHNP